jgi:hypothetical protein
MRQKDDLPYQELLQRAETCSLTQADIDLNTRTVAALESAGLRIPDRAIRPINTDRHDYNRSGAERLATDRDQKVWMFAGNHDRPPRSSSQGHISIGSMLSQATMVRLRVPVYSFITRECQLRRQHQAH